MIFQCRLTELSACLAQEHVDQIVPIVLSAEVRKTLNLGYNSGDEIRNYVVGNGVHEFETVSEVSVLSTVSFTYYKSIGTI